MVPSAPASSLSRPARMITVALIAVAVFAVAVSVLATTATASTPPAPEPVATEPPPAEPTTPAEPVTTAAPDSTTADRDITIITTPDDDDTDWLWIVVLIGLGVAVLALIVYLIGRRKPTPTHKTAPAAPVASPQSDLLDTAQWIHDQFSIQLLAATPPTALARWSVERSRLDSVAIGAHQVYVEGGGDMWQRLEQIMTVLATSIDTNVQLRVQDPPNVQLIAESADVVNRHRVTLQQAINVLRSSLPR